MCGAPTDNLLAYGGPPADILTFPEVSNRNAFTKPPDPALYPINPKLLSASRPVNVYRIALFALFLPIILIDGSSILELLSPKTACTSALAFAT